MVAKGAAWFNNPLHEDTRILTREHGWTRLGDIAGARHGAPSTHDYGARAGDGTGAGGARVDSLATISERESTVSGTRDGGPARQRDHRGQFAEPPMVPAAAQDGVGACRRMTSAWGLPPDRHAVVALASLPFAVLHGLFFGDGTRSNGELHLFGTEGRGGCGLCSPGAAFDRTLTRRRGACSRQCPSRGQRFRWRTARTGGTAEGVSRGPSPRTGMDQKGKRQVSCTGAGFRAVAELFRAWGSGVRTPVEVIPEGRPTISSSHRAALYSIRLTALDLRAELFVHAKTSASGGGQPQAHVPGFGRSLTVFGAWRHAPRPLRHGARVMSSS